MFIGPSHLQSGPDVAHPVIAAMPMARIRDLTADLAAG
jgi:hypothetical protein